MKNRGIANNRNYYLSMSIWLKVRNNIKILFLFYFIYFFVGCTSQTLIIRPSQRAKEISKIDSSYNAGAINNEGSTKEFEYIKLKKVVDSYIGVPYRYKGTTKRGMDCSGFVWRVFHNLGYSEFPRTSSAELHKLGRSITLRAAKLGDLVFFKKWGRVFHVGIYMENDMFVHANKKKGVTYTSLNNEYFGRRFADIRRMY